jgi:hypothetical protein
MSYPKQPGLSVSVHSIHPQLKTFCSWKIQERNWNDLIWLRLGGENVVCFFSRMCLCVCVVIASRRRRRRHNSPDWTSMGIPIGWYGLPTTCATNSTFDGGLTSIGLLLRKKKKKLFAFQIYLEFGKPTSNDSLLQPLSSFNHVHHLFLPPPCDSCVIGSLHGRPVEPTKQTRKSIGKEEEKTHAERMFLLLVMSPF